MINITPYEYGVCEFEFDKPKCIHKADNYAFQFWCRALLQRVMSVFRIDNLPEAWQGELEDFLETLLIAFGYVAVAESKTVGIYYSAGSLSGRNMYYQPTIITLCTPDPALCGKQLKIHKDCELLRFTPDYRGIQDTIVYYAAKLALIDTSVNTALLNSKMPYNLLAKSKGAAAALKMMVDRSLSGEACTIADNVIKPDKVDNPDGKDSLVEQIKLFSKSDYITTDLLNDFSTILNQFDAEVGIPSVPYEKKERLVKDEANSRKLDSTARARVWLNSLTSSCKLINKKFGLNLRPVLTINEFNDEHEKEDDADVSA